MSILADIPRQATIRACTACVLISISRPNFRTLTKVVPEVGKYARRIMCIYALSKLFRCMLSEESLLMMSRKYVQFRLLPTCELVEVAQGVRLMEKGEEETDFFFIYHGQVAALHCNESKDSSITTQCELGASNAESKINLPDEEKQFRILGPGAYFGEISIITRSRCQITMDTVSR